MRPRDVLLLASESLALHRVRTGLTLVAIAIGLTSVLALTALGEAAKRYVLEQFAGVGSYLITVSPGRIESSGLGSAGFAAGERPLTLDDADAVRRHVAQAARVVPLSLGAAPVEYGSRHRDVYLVGATGDYAVMRDLRLQQGAFLPGGSRAGREHVVVLGSKLARELFGDAPATGRSVRVSNARFRVIGVMASKGMSLGLDFDDMALVPVGAGMSLLGRTSLHHILVQSASAEALPNVSEQVRALLADRHRREDFTLVTQDAMLSTVRGILDVLTLSLSAIAAVSLLVAGVGIMNVMLVSVSERIGEIGLLKSLGGRPGDIRMLFLAEAAALCALGAALGLLAHVAMVAVVRRLWPQFPVRPEPFWLAAGVLFVLLLGLLFGWLPARRAARWPAAEALRKRV